MCPVSKGIDRASWRKLSTSPFYLESNIMFLYFYWQEATVFMIGERDYYDNRETSSYKHIIISDKTFDSFIIIVSPSQRETPLYKHIILCHPHRRTHQYINTLYCVTLPEEDTII